MTAPGRHPRRSGPARSGADARAARSRSPRPGGSRSSSRDERTDSASDRREATSRNTAGDLLPTVRISRPDRDAAGRTTRVPRSRTPGPARSGRPAGGSAAVAGRLSAGSARPPARNKSRSTITRHVLLFALALFATAAVLAVPIRTFLAGRTDLSHELATEQQLKDQLAALNTEKDALNDPNYLAQQAKERLQYVKPGDTPYVIHAPAITAPDAPAPAKAPTAEPWYSNLWDTVAPAK